MERITCRQTVWIKEQKICHIVAILPHKEDFLALNQQISDFPYTVLEYGNINFEQYKHCSAQIDTFAKKSGNRNVMGIKEVFHLTNFHNDEFPNIQNAVGLVLSQIDRENYHKIENDMINGVNDLF